MNHQLGEHCHVNHDNIANNTRRKRREVEDSTPPPMNQTLTLGVAPHFPLVSAQPNVVVEQRHNTNNLRSNEPQMDPM